MENFTIALCSDRINWCESSLHLNTKLLRDSNRMVMKPVNSGRILSVSVSSDKSSAYILPSNRNTKKVEVERLVPWKWQSEIHIYQAQNDCVHVRGCHKYSHHMMTESDYCVIQIGDLSVFVNTDKRSFYMDAKKNLGRFLGSEIREGVYDTSIHEARRNLVIGLSNYQSDLLSIEETDSISES